MEKRIGSIIKYVGYTGIGLMFIGLMESAAGLGAEFTSKSFTGYLKGLVSFSGADTLMAGIYIVLAAPIAGLAYVLFHGLRIRSFRLVFACAVIAVMLAAVIFIRE